MYTGIVSIADIREFGSRIIVTERLVKELADGSTRIVPQGKRFVLKNGEALEERHYFVGKQKKFLLGKPVPLKDLYDRIKFVYDASGVLIARRRNGRLRSTAKGMAKRIS